MKSPGSGLLGDNFTLRNDKIPRMDELPLLNKTILVTGAARRVGRLFALACAHAGADVIVHHGHSQQEALDVQKEIATLGRQSWILEADLSNPNEVSRFISKANGISPIYGLVNSAAIFEPLSLEQTTLADWERHLAINLTAPFLLGQAFAKQLSPSSRGSAPDAGTAARPLRDGGESNVKGRIVNILDWRALRPGADHFPYSVSKAALAAMTKSMAVALAPRIPVNGLALGAVLPPADEAMDEKVIERVPAQRWSGEKEIGDALIFLLTGPAYITGEILHVDGGRHLV
jgi:NAD(P)-dependent dehydrogenase (short-subunit alcohol dehydrogenase family)